MSSVSDSNLDELHAFAAKLGCRRVGFQGDHYDIDVATRAVAVGLGAIECESRELVRKLRDAGLRVRPSTFEKWSLVSRGVAFTDESIRELGELEHAPLAQLMKTLSTLTDVAEACRRSSGWFVLGRENSAALVVHGTDLGVVGPNGSVPVGDDQSRGIFVRVDRGDPPSWAVEIINPSPRPNE